MSTKTSLPKRVFLIVISSFVIVMILVRVVFYFTGDDFFYHLKVKDMERRAEAIAERLEKIADHVDITNNIYFHAIRVGGVVRVYDLDGNLTYSSLPLKDDLSGSLQNGSLPAPIINVNVLKAKLRNSPDGAFRYTDEVRQVEWLNYKLRTPSYYILISMALPTIHDSVLIFGNILNLTLLIAFIAAIFASILVAHHISKPLLELNQIAAELGELNFSNRYTSTRKDEIGQLGATLNNLAERLKSTIDRLHQELRKERTTEQQRRNFVARASHELQTPLAVINGYTEALQDGVVENDQELADYYSIIRSEIAKLSKMVRDLLELSRLEAPEFTIQMHTLNCNELICGIVEKLHASYNLPDQRIETNLGKTSYLVQGDSLRLEQAISNILNNALRHTPEGGIIRITADRVGLDVKYSIYNSGSHISESNLSLIWDSFYTTDIDKGTSGGTGLGLAIAKQIFLRHDCLFGAENTPDGVIFWFTIKLVGE